MDAFSQNQPENSQPEQPKIKILQGFEWTIGGVLLGIGFFLLVFLLLNYFNIISLSTLYPNQLGWLPTKNQVIVEVNGEKIFKADYNKRLAAQTYFYTNISPASQTELVKLPNQTLEDFIQEKLLTKLLLDRGITVTDEEVMQKIKTTSVNKLFGGDLKKYEEALQTRYHTTLAEVKRTARLEILKGKTAQLQTLKHILAIWIAKNEPQFASNDTMTQKMRDDLDIANKPKKDKADTLLHQIKSGADFATLAKESSEDPKSSKNGGDLGFLFLPISKNSKAQETLNMFPGQSAVTLAFTELGKGETKLYEIFTGYAIIKTVDVKEGPLGQQSFDNWYKTFRAKAKVTIF